MTALADMLDRPSWQAQGACVGVDPDVFYDEAYDDGNPARSRRAEGLERARAICATCPVQEECLEHALTRPERFGVWAGTTPPERRQLQKARAKRAE